jgi:ABC-type molybdate transport system substrate-binding protein
MAILKITILKNINVKKMKNFQDMVVGEKKKKIFEKKKQNFNRIMKRINS